MDSEFIKAFGVVFGFLFGGGFLYTAVRIGKGWGSVSDTLSSTAHTVEKIQAQQKEDGDALRDVQFILVGVDGKNGLRSDVQSLKDWVQDADKRNYPPKPKKRRAS